MGFVIPAICVRIRPSQQLPPTGPQATFVQRGNTAFKVQDLKRTVRQGPTTQAQERPWDQTANLVQLEATAAGPTQLRLSLLPANVQQVTIAPEVQLCPHSLPLQPVLIPSRELRPLPFAVKEPITPSWPSRLALTARPATTAPIKE
jgi:hypothetical protein